MTHSADQAAHPGKHQVDPEFTAYPLRQLADAALQRAADLGAEHADFRAERVRGQQIGLSDGNLETLYDTDDLGLAVRVVVEGTWGFAAAVDLTPEAAARAADAAVDVARVAAAVNTERIELAPEPAHGDVTWVSAYQVDPFAVAVADKIALLAGWSAGLLASDAVDHVDASLLQVKECKFYTDGATTATQQRVRLHPSVTAVAVAADGRFETMRTLAPPAGRGYEYLPGPARRAPGGRLGLRRRARRAPGAAGRQAGRALGAAGPLRPGRRPVEPVADHPRVDRARDRARPRPRLRGRVRGHLLRHPGQAGHACSTARR